LAVVIGFVFGDVEHLAKLFMPISVSTTVEPFVIAFFEFGEIFFARFVEDVEVVIEIVTFDGFARGLVEIHGYVPISF